MTEAEVEASVGLLATDVVEQFRLPFGEARRRATAWLLTAFLRDAIELAGLFLNECLLHVELFSAARSPDFRVEDFNAMRTLDKSTSQLFLPDKILQLEKKIGRVSSLSPHVLSLNKVRGCIVHRQGRVSETPKVDIDESGTLLMKWRNVRLFACSPDGPTEELITEPGTFVRPGWRVEARIADEEHRFAPGVSAPI